MKDIIDKITDFFFNLSKKFDKISDQIYQKTGNKINVGMIFWGTILFIFLFIFVKVLLSFIIGLLYS